MQDYGWNQESKIIAAFETNVNKKSRDWLSIYFAIVGKYISKKVREVRI